MPQFRVPVPCVVCLVHASLAAVLRSWIEPYQNPVSGVIWAHAQKFLGIGNIGKCCTCDFIANNLVGLLK
jgi:hypothetical protein